MSGAAGEEEENAAELKIGDGKNAVNIFTRETSAWFLLLISACDFLQSFWRLSV